MSGSYQTDPWEHLRQFTLARLALGRAGHALPTQAVLQFDLAHAQARDAVWLPLDFERLQTELSKNAFNTLKVHSQAGDRTDYLMRPDRGRLLNGESQIELTRHAHKTDLCLIVGDGLSANAVQQHALPLLQALRPFLKDFTVAPVILAEQARVALSDAIGATLGARMSVLLIGERPGLTSPDSLGVYLTYGPRIGRTDADRNCISNIRPEGLGYQAAAHLLGQLIKASLSLQLSGVNLKLSGENPPLPPSVKDLDNSD